MSITSVVSGRSLALRLTIPVATSVATLVAIGATIGSAANRAIDGAIGALRRHGLRAGALHLLGLAFEHLAAAIRRRAASWSNRRALNRAARELAGLDAQTLRDIATARCEAVSVALEAAGAIEATRVRTAMSPRA